MSYAGQVIDFQKHRVAKLMRETVGQQAELARSLRRTADDRARLVRILDETQRELMRVAESYGVLLDRLDDEKHFRDDCLAATELDDIDEMVRRRDELAQRLVQMRETSRRPLLADSK
jgi:hypothetical protein